MHKWLLAMALVLVTRGTAEAKTRSFVTLRDEGLVSTKPIAGLYTIEQSVMKAYAATGAKRPDVMSLWTTFPMDGNITETLFDELSNAAKGIGIDPMTSDKPPTRAILLHNDVTQLAARAKLQNAEADGFACYLFLLELSHVWGPNVQPQELTGFAYHWSFWMDAGGSPSGGNNWKDNGDGTFTVMPQAPSAISYSMLDLYLQGLADPSEVPPFGVLENAVPPADEKDPFFGGAYSASSFPWFGTTPFTVTATRKTITIEDVVAANGARVPARESGMMDLGIVLMVKQDATDDEVAALEDAFEPIAASLAPAYHDATHGRGTLTNVTLSTIDDAPEAGPDAEPTGESPPAATTTTTTSGCGVSPGAPGSAALIALALATMLARRRR